MKHMLTFLAVIGFLTISSAQDDEKKWTPSDIIHTEYMRSISISPDGQKVAWTKQKQVKEKDKFVSDIYLSRLDAMEDGKPRIVQMTSSDENDSSPFFSRDSETLYFHSSRDKGKKLWKMSLYGGEPIKVHDFENGISNIQWVTDTTFTYLSNDGKTLYEQELEKKKDDVVVVEDTAHWKKNRVYLFDLKKKKSQRLTTNQYPVSTYTVSKDGQWMIYRLTLSRHFASDANPDPKYYLQNIATGASQEVLSGYQTPRNFQFTESNNGFYFGAEISSDPEWNGSGVTKVYYYDLKSGQIQTVPLDWKWESEGSFQVIGDNVLVALANGPTNPLAFFIKGSNGWNKSMVSTGDRNEHVWVLETSKDGKKAVLEHSTASQLPKYYLADIQFNGSNLSFQNEIEICTVNKKLKSKPIVKSEILRWTGYNGDEVNGILYYPENYEKGKQYPLVLSIHGGPSGVDSDRWRERWSTYPQIIAQRGAFVLKPNYHGSSHHGQEFVESIKKNYYEPEMVDITSGIDVLVEKGMVDRSNLGVMGWSNGAILATMLTVRYPDMFKVACPGAGDVNWTSDFGTCRFGVSFDQSYFGGAPWDDVDGKSYNEAYIVKSPLFELEKVKTPTIIFHGSEDRSVPRDQGWEYYRALQQLNQTAVRFLWFPGQPHGLGKITHQMRKMEEELAWIDRYLFGKEDEKNEALKDESPLAMAIKKNKIKKSGDLFGVSANGLLTPEMAVYKKDSLSVSIFEVTNAQFAAYQNSHSFPATKANHPATVTFDQANKYAQWLSGKTGDQYRLPNEKEGKNWHEKAIKLGKKENTLNQWAGYDMTWEEVPMLEKEVTKLAQDLIQPVGAFAPSKVGKAEVYDIAGNVAEYMDNGKTYGYSALDFVDPAHSKTQPKAGFIGFRIVQVHK
jgi:dipeptidyl aminopeptidase/acylaminoacyl peptidase